MSYASDMVIHTVYDPTNLELPAPIWLFLDQHRDYTINEVTYNATPIEAGGASDLDSEHEAYQLSISEHADPMLPVESASPAEDDPSEYRGGHQVEAELDQEDVLSDMVEQDGIYDSSVIRGDAHGRDAECSTSEQQPEIQFIEVEYT